jgi:hypothetical protein
MAGAAGLLLLIVFDLGPPLAFNDDWLFTWSVRHLSPHVHLYPGQAPYALVQIAWAVILTAGHHDVRLLRLTLIPFAILGAVSSYRLARALGADTFWAAVAGVLLLCTPVYMNLATSFMSDVPYVALVLAATAAGAAWVGASKAKASCVALALLATLQRQNGLLLAPAITAALVLRGSGRQQRADLPWIAALWAGCGAALLGPLVLGVASPSQATRASTLGLVQPASVARSLLGLPAVAALVLTPFLGFLVVLRSGPSKRTSLRLLACVLAVIVAVLALLPPLNGWTWRGFGPLTIEGPKPYVLHPLLIALMAGLGAATAGGLVWRWRSLDPREMGAAGTIPQLVAAFQLLPVLVVPQAFERYYLPVLAPLVPLLAARAAMSGRSTFASVWAVCCLVAGVVVFAALEQDYQSWQDARDRAAQIAYQQAAPDRVNAGYEANAVYVELPQNARTGWHGALDGVGKGDPTVEGPPHPALILAFAPETDTHPGVSYRSLGSGRVVILPGDGSSR